jgi:hypothetical protein
LLILRPVQLWSERDFPSAPTPIRRYFTILTFSGAAGRAVGGFAMISSFFRTKLNMYPGQSTHAAMEHVGA